MRISDRLRTALWTFTARPLRMGGLCVALACTLISVSTLACVVAGYSRQIEERTFGDLAHRVSLEENRFILDRFGPLRIEHLVALRARIPRLSGASAWRSTQSTVKHASHEIVLPLLGIYGEIGGMNSEFKIAHGRFFDLKELSESYRGDRRICLLGAFAERQLCDNDQACSIDKIHVNGVQCTVIGALQAPRGLAEQSFSDAVIVPFFSAARLFEHDGKTDLRAADRLELVVADSADPNAVRAQIAKELRALYGSPVSAPSPFLFTNDVGSLDLLQRQRATFEGLLVVVISAAGIGGFVTFASIMVGMVNERRREIALRSAFGARFSDIIWQVLLEAGLVAIVAASVAALSTAGIVTILDRFGSTPLALNGPVIAMASSLAMAISLTAAYPIAMSALNNRGNALSS